MLVLEVLGKIYPNGVHALERFAATIQLGEIVAIIGGSGCGKSTLLRAVAGLDPATSGTVTLDGVTITAPHAKIGIIFQEPRLLPWLDERKPDVVCLQETKLADDAFSALVGEDFASRGYEIAMYGEPRWNGVAILSRVGLADVETGIAGAPGFPDPEARAVAATCGGVRVWSLYVPNGREPDSDHYRYKLAWLAAFRSVIAAGPADVLVCGDMNIAPADADVFDPDAYIGQTHVTEPERAALEALLATGLHDVVRDKWPTQRVFTYWDYRAGAFHKGMGMRIDLVYANAALAGAVSDAWVDREARKGKGPSDHAPVVVDLS